MNCNLPALAAEIVSRIRNSMGDSAHNQATVVQNLIAEAMEKKSEPSMRPLFSLPEEIREFQIKVEAEVARVVRKNNLRIEQLTEAQCAQAIIQAFQCGDFKRLVRASDNAQQVIYAPWQESEMQQAKIKELQDELDELKAILSNPAAVWTNMLRGTIAMPQAIEHGEKCKSELEQVQNALDNYWRTQPDTLSAVQAAVADANKFRIQAANARQVLISARQRLLEVDSPDVYEPDLWAKIEAAISEISSA